MPSEQVLRRLAFIRYLHRLGVEQSYAPEALAPAAILTSHDSIELFLQLAAEVLNAGGPIHEFMKYFDGLDQKLAPRTLSQRDSMLRLSKARAALKHHGTMPSRAAVEGFRVNAGDFFAENTPLVFGISIEEVSLAYLIERAEVREALIEADKCLAENRRGDSLLPLALALAREFRARRLDSRYRGPGRLPLRGDEGRLIAGAVKHLDGTVERLSREVELLRHGIDSRQLEVFKELTPSVFIADAGNASFMGGKSDPTPEDVRFCYDFVVDTVLDLQEQDSRVRGVMTRRMMLMRRAPVGARNV
jgi:hypothetical protein